jgi:hypothetical protein
MWQYTHQQHVGTLRVCWVITWFQPGTQRVCFAQTGVLCAACLPLQAMQEQALAVRQWHSHCVLLVMWGCCLSRLPHAACIWLVCNGQPTLLADPAGIRVWMQDPAHHMVPARSSCIVE